MRQRDKHTAGCAGAIGALLVAMVSLACGRGADAGEPTIHRRIWDTTYRLRLVFEDDFDNLDNWLVETTGKVVVKNNWLVWDCFSGGKQAGTIWCKREFAGPTVVQFDAVGEAGARNLNFILYATHPKGLPQTTKSRTGEYKEYHVFPNYIGTYLTPRVEGESGVFSTMGNDLYSTRPHYPLQPPFRNDCLNSTRSLTRSRNAALRPRDFSHRLRDKKSLVCFAR